MAMASSPTPSSRPSPPPPLSPFFSTVTEQDRVEEEEEEVEGAANHELSSTPYKHHPTPLHSSTAHPKKPPRSDEGTTCPVSFNKCRPSSRDKITVVPVDANGHRRTPTSLSPNVLRSLFLSITGKSPCASSVSASSAAAAREEEWRLAAAELSRKLAHATRKRDEALLESSRLKHSVSELERKLAGLETYCHNLQAAIDQRPAQPPPVPPLAVEPFLRAVSDARSAVRHLGRALVAQIRHGAAGPRAVDRVSSLVQAGDVRGLGGQGLLLCMEALLNRVFYGEFEAEAAEGEEEGAAAPLDPAARCEASRAAVEAVRGVGWEEVLSKGTRHYSEGLSRCCDRWMSEVVGALGWARAWPEPLLQAFFGAAKGAWVVRLMARSVDPPVPILRIDRGARFDPGYMEDAAAGGGERRSPVAAAGVRAMVAPGFYVYSSSTCGVVKCRVLCLYGSGNSSSHSSDSGGKNGPGGKTNGDDGQ